MSAMACHITGVSIACCMSIKHQSFASPAFVRGIQRWQVDSPHKGPVARKKFPIDDGILTMHYDDVIMTTMASQVTSLAVVYSTVYSDTDQRKHQSSASLAFVWGIHRDRWIPRTKGQLRGKCFHLMTSSWQQTGRIIRHFKYTCCDLFADRYTLIQRWI